MTTNADITILNRRISKKDRREVFFATQISGVSWYEVKNQQSTTDRAPGARFSIRIPVDAVIEGGRKFINEEAYKRLTDEQAAGYWTIQRGSYVVKEQFENESDWEFDTFSFEHGYITTVNVDTVEKLRSLNENFATVIEYADNTERGSKATKHWRIGGE